MVTLDKLTYAGNVRNLAALDGDGAAIWDLATREADGRGMPRDLSIAAKLYEKLASAGYAPAQYKLAGHYEKGSGVVRDLDKAKLWYGRAAEQGHARSMHNLAVLYAENPAANGKPDFASAASWFRQGAEFGVRDAQGRLPYHSWFAGFVPKDPYTGSFDDTTSQLAVVAFAYDSRTVGNVATEIGKYFLMLHYGVKRDYRMPQLLERGNFYGD